MEVHRHELSAGQSHLATRARGIVLGALIGDAAGGVLEFLGRAPTDEEVDRALAFPGGGVLGLAPGQITDDGELMLCLANGLATPLDALPQVPGDDRSRRVEAIARQYYRWIASRPFDIGTTTISGLGAATAADYEAGTCAQTMIAAARAHSMGRKANGSLMRCMPLAVWGHRLPVEQLAELARADSGLSHPNPSCRDSVAAYVIALAWLLRHPGDHAGALASAGQWVSEHVCDEVRGWIAMIEADEAAPFHPQVGFIKIAFTHAFRHLARATSYPDAIRQTLLGGGDTDTNACIVGGMMGALHGLDRIPAAWPEAVLRCDTQRGQPRPGWLSAATVPALIDRLLDSASAAPTELS